MLVRDLLAQLQQMADNGKGDFEVVHVDGVGKEKDVIGFEVVETGFFTVVDNGDKRARLNDEIGKRKRERSRLRLFTHSPF